MEQNREPGRMCAPMERSGLQTGRDRAGMRLGQLSVHTSGDIFRFLSHNRNKNNFQVD